MFQLTREEYNSLRFQIGTLKRGAHSKYLPFAFTEQGVGMLSGILNSDRAIRVNIEIMRAFVQMRRWMENNKELTRKIEALEKNYDAKFRAVFDAIKQLIHLKNKPRKPVGFKIPPKK